MIFGSNPYSIESNLCCAALHSEVITSDGGFFNANKFELNLETHLKGSLKN